MPTSPPRHRPSGWKPPATTARDAERDRGSASRRGYDRLWQKFRLVILARDPLCLLCLEVGRLTASHQVDHIKPIAERPDLRLAPCNVRGLCDSCHSRRTATYKGDTPHAPGTKA